MKVLVFTTLFPNQQMPQHGLFIKARIAALVQKHEIRVVAPVPYFPKWNINKKWFQFSQIPQQEVIDGITVYHPRYLVTPKIGRPLYGFFMFLGLYPFVKHLQKKFDFDLIDAHFIYPDGFAAIWIGRLLWKKVVLNARGTDINWYPKFQILRRLIQSTLKQANAIVSVSEYLKSEMVALGIDSKKIHVVPNGVDSAIFHFKPKEAMRKKLNLPIDAKIILTVGLLIERKGFHFLIKALAHINDPNVQLIIIGDGDENYLNDLIEQHQLKSRVKIVGSKCQSDLSDWYAAADIFALTSLREGRPNVVLEALACGTPIVSMDKWELSQFVTYDRGILLATYDPKEIARVITNVLQRQWNRKEISDFMRQFDWKQSAEKIDAILANVKKQNDVLFFSSDDWNSGLKTSKYHLSTRLANGGNRVFFVNSIGLRAPTFSGQDCKKIITKLRGYFRGTSKVRENLYLYTPIVIPFQRSTFIRSLNKRLLILQFRFLMAKYHIKKPIIWTFLPNTLDLIRQLPRKGLVYYCVDDMSAFQGVPDDLIRRQDEELTREADVTFSVSKELFDKKYRLNQNSFYSPHGVDFELFNQACTDSTITKPADIEGVQPPIIGFYGLISADWIDYKLVQFLAQQRPEWSFVFIGKIDRKPGDGFAENTNIHYLPVKPYEELYRYSRFFDVAILPFNINALTLHSHPLKILEYLSAGRPVVSVDIPEARNYTDVIEVASDYPDFLKKIEHSLAADTPARQKARVEFASKKSWEKRFHAVQDIIRLHI